ncbi:anthranilate synthase component I [Oharaeibacter diazotrophicus]|uniref:Anthranilate synthase n=1 Tax=Oharaeibacter diazotrophicus TaxID=1920512 RepID=A0A4R6RAX8_9HYPH|nr:anthranilate synthase component I [Oharaeibacter diazotrophicus]TDP83192.1 anthranilate synthase component I [Oharaeibacter diazotrophicus]BBE72021.1 anthranilate synthase component 1 [Pleomorphomonas sp. SM30]
MAEGKAGAMAETTREFTTAGGVAVERRPRQVPYKDAALAYVDMLDERRGAVLSSNYEYPGRYSRWDIAFVDPPVALTARGRDLVIEALNARGRVLLPAFDAAVRAGDDLAAVETTASAIRMTVKTPAGRFAEEERSRQPSVFSVIRRIVAHFRTDEDGNLGLWGSFGYDLAFQFEPVRFRLERPADQRDLVLYFPDEILIVDHYGAEATVYAYDFTVAGAATAGLPRDGSREPFRPSDRIPGRGDHEPGEYAAAVGKAVEYFKRGDLFEVVPGQTFYERPAAPPSAISRKLQEINPSPYGFMFNLGEQEYLVGASPEMYVRVSSGRRVETCPISGTIRRGRNAIEDEAQIRTLLNSKKDEAELTMCSDVDRNDKSRICEPGSVRVIGRRQIELYSRLIHTVDHIEGRLRDDMDALDAFLSHAWAVTVTGAPKLWAMQFIEDHEKSPRAWYGGAVGAILMNGDLNTGLTLRTVRIKHGVAEVRAGATLLYDSDPHEEERETELKASAMIAAIRDAGKTAAAALTNGPELVGAGLRVVLVDHEDSFVHTLANYFRQTGATVTTVRSSKGVGVDPAEFDRLAPDLVVMSPGPGSPSDFHCTRTIQAARERDLPVFGVCLGLQAMAEVTGATLARLEIPVHGKPSEIAVARNSMLFTGLPERIIVGRYHSIHALPETLPEGFAVTAATDDGVVMAIEHQSEPMAAVQFHPESIMTLGDDAGHRIVENAIRSLVGRKARGGRAANG